MIEQTEAQAAPGIPRPRPKMKTGSRAALTSGETTATLLPPLAGAEAPLQLLNVELDEQPTTGLQIYLRAHRPILSSASSRVAEKTPLQTSATRVGPWET